MKLQEVLNEAQSGHKRLVSSIVNMVKARTGKKPSWISVEFQLKKMDRDEAFMTRIKKQAAKYGNDGYYWSAIRQRIARHYK